MPRTLNLLDLASHVTRRDLTYNSPRPGFRVIRRVSPQSGNLLQKTFSYVVAFFGDAVELFGWFLSPFAPVINLSFTALWSSIVQTTSYIYNFNWNITDQQIDQQLKVTNQVLAGLLGQQIGNGLGFLACGIVPSAAIAVYNEPLGLYLLETVGEEALEEFAGNLAALITISFRLAARNTFLSSYKNIRNMVKLLVSDPGSPYAVVAKSFLGGNYQEVVSSWGGEGSRPWSFRLAVESKINNIQNPAAQAFWEELYEETLDACVEAGYVIAGGIDTWLLERSIENSATQTQADYVGFQPDREAPEETLVTWGDRQQIENQIISALNQHQQFWNRDVGQIIGEPLIDSVRRPPFDLVLRILFRSVPRPVWKNPDGTLAKRTQITIPGIKLSKLDWSTIKNAVGGTNGYMWGRYRFEVRLEDEHRIQFYAASEAAGENLLEKILTLTNADLQTLNVIEETKEGARTKYSSIYKKPTRVYPAMLTIMNQQKIVNQDVGRHTARGVYINRRYLFPLYTNSAPDDFNQVKQEIITTQNSPMPVG
ncbi:MAG: hypothetical protein AB4372_10115 [Xenococcus sp. (in: cyanobacteria)]